MRKSIKKFYEHKRSYDFADTWGYTGRRAQKNHRFVKKRAHKRARRQPILYKEVT